MKDLFNNYHKQKALSHLWILAISLVLAVSINMFLLGGTSGESLKANIKELQTQDIITQDISITQENNILSIQNKQVMDQVLQLSISLAYNPDLLVFWDTISSLPGASISKIETTPGFSSFILVFDSPVNFSKDTQIINLSYTRIGSETIHLNPININFIDSGGNNYSLSASSLIF